MSEHTRRSRVKGTGPAIVSCTPEAIIDEYDPRIRKQVARTFGLPMKFDHPDVEALYKLSDTPYHYPLLERLYETVAGGARYQEGDRVVFQSIANEQDYTVEFRSTTINGEKLLRAVILELDCDYQALSSEQAAAEIAALCESESNWE